MLKTSHEGRRDHFPGEGRCCILAKVDGKPIAAFDTVKFTK